MNTAKAEIKRLKAALKKSEAEYEKLEARLAEYVSSTVAGRDVWFSFHQELMNKLGLADQGLGRVKLTKAMASIDPKTGRIKTPVLEQLQTLPPFGPMLRAALEIEAISEFVFQTVAPPNNFRAYTRWLRDIFHNLACRTLNAIPHAYQPGKEEDQAYMMGGQSERYRDLRPEVLEIIDNATDVIGYRLRKQYQQEVEMEAAHE